MQCQGCHKLQWALGAMGIFLLVSVGVVASSASCLRDPNYHKLANAAAAAAAAAGGGGGAFVDVSRVIAQLRSSGGGGVSDGSCAAVAMDLRNLQAAPFPASLCYSHSWLQMKLMLLRCYYFPHPFYMLLQRC